MNTDYEKSATAAVRWWADRVRDGVGIGDNGAPDHMPSVMAMVLAQGTRVRIPDIRGIADRMESILAAAIYAKLLAGRSSRSGWDEDGNIVDIDVDYHPYGILRESLVAAGLADYLCECVVPLKTHMNITARYVHISAGYGAGWEEIHGPAWGCSLRERQAMRQAYGVENSRIYNALVELREQVLGHNWSYRDADTHPELFSNGHDDWYGPVRW